MLVKVMIMMMKRNDDYGDNKIGMKLIIDMFFSRMIMMIIEKNHDMMIILITLTRAIIMILIIFSSWIIDTYYYHYPNNLKCKFNHFLQKKNLPSAHNSWTNQTQQSIIKVKTLQTETDVNPLEQNASGAKSATE